MDVILESAFKKLLVRNLIIRDPFSLSDMWLDPSFALARISKREKVALGVSCLERYL